jgi:hypothetical protein
MAHQREGHALGDEIGDGEAYFFGLQLLIQSLAKAADFFDVDVRSSRRNAGLLQERPRWPNASWSWDDLFSPAMLELSRAFERVLQPPAR